MHTRIRKITPSVVTVEDQQEVVYKVIYRNVNCP